MCGYGVRIYNGYPIGIKMRQKLDSHYVWVLGWDDFFSLEIGIG